MKRLFSILIILAQVIFPFEIQALPTSISVHISNKQTIDKAPLPAAELDHHIDSFFDAFKDRELFAYPQLAYFPRGALAVTPPPGPDIVLDFANNSTTNCTFATCVSTDRVDVVQWFDSTGAWFTCAFLTTCINGYGILNQAPSTNMVLWSQDFDNAYWVKNNTTVTANSTIAPDGTLTADTITETATNSFHSTSQSASTTFTSGFTYAFSHYFKQGTNRYIQLTLPFGQFVNVPFANYDLQTCQVTYAATNNTQVSPLSGIAGAKSLNNGLCWVWLIAQASSNAAGTGLNIVMINSPSSARIPVYPGAGGSVIAWGAQVETLAPSSYMATFGSTTFRNGDNLQAIGPLATILNGSQGYVAATLGQMYAVPVVPGQVIVGRNNLIDTILQMNSATAVGAKSTNSIIAQSTLGSAPNIIQGPIKVAASWNTTKISTVINGGTVGTFTGGFSSFGTPYIMGPGPGVAGTSGRSSGYLQKLTVGNIQPSDAALAAAAPVSGISLGAGTILVTAPTNAEVVSGFKTLTVTSTNGNYLTGVQFIVDGSTIATLPSWTGTFTFNWNSSTVLDGSHTIVATGTDLLGNTGTSPTINFTTNNGTIGGNLHYFANGGVDTGICTNIAAPCATIAYANTLTYQIADQILFNGGNTFVGCLVINGQTNWLSTQANPGTIGSYGTGTYTINPNCTGESGGIRLAAASGVIVQDGTVTALTVPTPRGAVIVQNGTSSAVNGITIQRMNLSGTRYFQSTAPAGGQGQNGGNLFYEGFPGNGGFNGLQMLNNTICGTSGPTSGDDAAITGFGNTPLNILNVTMQGNIACNMGGGPVAALGFGAAYPPMGDGIDLQAMQNALAQFNLSHDNGGNFHNCGGPASHLTARVISALIQFGEGYNITYSPSGVSNYVSPTCDDIGLDLDNDSQNSLAQYFYSHDNAGEGFLLFMNNTGLSGGWHDNAIRYGITENDDRNGATGMALVQFDTRGGARGSFYNITAWNNLTFNGSIFGNVNVCAPGLANVNTGGWTGSIAKNNLFALSKCSTNGGNNFWSPINMRGINTGSAGVLANNLYFNMSAGSPALSFFYGATNYTNFATYQGATSQDANSIINSNPLISGTPPFGVCTWTPSSATGPQPCPGSGGSPTYGLTVGSPAISAGAAIGALPTTPTRDYYGNAVNPATCSNIGAFGTCP